MRIVFAGTPDFANTALNAILDAGYIVDLVLTQPDRPSGRGMRMVHSPVKKTALEKNITVCQPTSLKLDGKYASEAASAQQKLKEANPDVIIVAAYGLILPQWVLDMPKYGCINIHASLLPRWRGAAPIQRSIQFGDAKTGITIMQMDAGLDTGDMLLTMDQPIGETDTAASLHDKLAKLGGVAILKCLQDLKANKTITTKQPELGVTYAEKLSKTEAQLDFSLSAQQLHRNIRAFNPFPVATMQLPNIQGNVKVWDAVIKIPTTPVFNPIGSIIKYDENGIDILTSDGVLSITELQKPGGKRQSVKTFVQGWSP